jgi:2',3'-cyclic-nucleotide 2'-phosphodiesterase (5'-nucleotidase family)
MMLHLHKFPPRFVFAFKPFPRSKVGPGGALTPIGPADTLRFVTNDFMVTGGDGYTALAGGTDILQPGDGLLEVTIEYITAHSPVAPAVEGRIVRTP